MKLTTFSRCSMVILLAGLDFIQMMQSTQVSKLFGTLRTGATLIPTVVLKIDSTIHLIYPYPMEKHQGDQLSYPLNRKKIYTLESTIHLLNNSGQIARPLLVMLVSVSKGQYKRSSFQSSYLCTPSHHLYIPSSNDIYRNQENLYRQHFGDNGCCLLRIHQNLV